MNDSSYNRRSFLKASAAATAGLGVASLGLPSAAAAQEEPLRIGFVGVGDRGSYHLSVALGMPGVRVPALCDISNDYLYRAKRWVEDAGQPTPNLYGKTKTDFERMMGEEDLDCVICATSWEWHAPVCLSAMRNEIHAVSEVPIVQTLDEAWEIVETWEKTGYWATLALEQALLESSWGTSVFHLIKQGVLGELIHAESGYVHDLRLVKFDPEREPWRLEPSIERNGSLYPDHPMSKIMPMMDINHGDRFDFLVSVSSKSIMLNQYAAETYGDDHPYATKEMKQGDYNASLIRTMDGKLITLNFDTNTPHPRENFRIQGSEGVFFTGSVVDDPLIYLDGISPESHQWEKANDYLNEYVHPLIANYDPPERKEALRGHGGRGRQTPITWHLLAQALRNDMMPWFDVYDSVTSSAIVPVSIQSVSEGGPVKFPDFTRGKWKERPSFTLELDQPLTAETGTETSG